MSNPTYALTTIHVYPFTVERDGRTVSHKYPAQPGMARTAADQTCEQLRNRDITYTRTDDPAGALIAYDDAGTLTYHNYKQERM